MNRKEFVCYSSLFIPDRFITSINCTNTGQLLLGLSDGTIHMELAEGEGLFNHSREKEDSIDSRFWKLASSPQAEDNYIDFATHIILSPNETHAVYNYTSGKIGISRITSDKVNDTYGKLFKRWIEDILNININS